MSQSESVPPSPFRAPYNPFDEPEVYQAYQEGWTARSQRRPRTDNPYPLSRPDEARAWLDGWTAAAEEQGMRVATGEASAVETQAVVA